MTPEVSGPPPAWARRFVAFTLRHARLIWAIAIVLAIPATARTVGLYAHLKTDIEELLPRASTSVKAIDELRERMSGIQHLGVIIDVGDAANLPAGERMLDDLAAKVRAYPPALVRSVRVGPEEERKFLESRAPLYIDLDDLKTIRAKIEARRDYEVAKATGSLLDDDGPPPLAFDDLERKYRERTGGAEDRFPSGRFSSAEQRVTLLLIEVGAFTTGGGSAELLRRVKADLQALGGTDHYAPGMRSGFTGDVAISVEETEALMEDLSISSVIVLVAVLGAIVAFYRWRWSVVVLIPPLLVGMVLTFALSSLPPASVTALNSNTAFLGSIILGNGINFGIVLLARYVEERRAGADLEQALAVAVAGARAGTLVASLAAGVAYASLGVTEFRGFRQFGVIGGIGMVVCWLCTFTLVPSLIAWLDRRGHAPTRTAQMNRATGMGRVAWLVETYPRRIVVVAALLTIAALAQLRSFGADQIEYNLSRLRRADTWTSGEGYWGAKMNALLGSYLTPTVILADTKEQAQTIARSVREATRRAPLDEMVASVRTLDDVLPTDQAAKIAEIAAIRADITPRLRALIPADRRALVDRMLGSGPIEPVTIADLPPTFTLGMRERDGSIGRTVLVYPRPSKALWVGPTITAFVDGLRAAAAPPRIARPGRVAGSLPLSADIFGSLGRDGPLATGIAFVGVAVLVLVVFRAGATGLTVVASLVVGVLWLAALAMVLHIRLNFTNFIAYPITFGIGVDYAVNIMSRYAQEGSRDAGRAVRSTGGAVVLCSVTTILGYSSLLLAKNRALFYFGLLAVLGEIACLSTAVIALPALLTAWNRRKTPGSGHPRAIESTAEAEDGRPAA